jgi:hypothetical protein
MALLAGGLFAIPGTQWWIEADETWVILPVSVTLVASFAIFYLQSRRAGEPRIDEQGSFWKWFGWLLLGVVPMLLLMLSHMAVTGFNDWFDRIEGSSIESLIFSVGIVLGTPMMVVSAGRAIDHGGQSGMAVMAATLRRAKPTLVVVTMLVALPEFATGLLSEVVRRERLPASADLGLAVVEVFFFFVNSLLTAGVYASVYRSVEHEIPAKATAG